MKQEGWRLFVKQAFDRGIAGVALIAVAPAMAALSVGVMATMGRPIFFRQKRPGLRGRIFEIVKFRTMTDARDSEGKLLSDEARLHPFGAFLRRTSLDELPQLLNVLRGDLSLVGPRPLLPSYLGRYDTEQARRHDVLPGVTGLTQIKGRNSISWPEKFALDLWYVDHWSLALDAKILLMTAVTVLRRDSAPEGRATMPEFMGNMEKGL